MHHRAATSPPPLALLLLLLAGLATTMMAPVVRAAASDFDFAHEVQRDFKMGLFPRQSTLNLQVRVVLLLCYITVLHLYFLSGMVLSMDQPPYPHACLALLPPTLEPSRLVD